jgi:hypothetical protein
VKQSSGLSREIIPYYSFNFDKITLIKYKSLSTIIFMIINSQTCPLKATIKII